MKCSLTYVHGQAAAQSLSEAQAGLVSVASAVMYQTVLQGPECPEILMGLEIRKVFVNVSLPIAVFKQESVKILRTTNDDAYAVCSMNVNY